MSDARVNATPLPDDPPSRGRPVEVESGPPDTRVGRGEGRGTRRGALGTGVGPAGPETETPLLTQTDPPQTVEVTPDPRDTDRSLPSLRPRRPVTLGASDPVS